MTAYRYDGTFAGFLTCVWDALESGVEPIEFLLPNDEAALWETRELAADEGGPNGSTPPWPSGCRPSFKA